jgi:hypothetical protein
LDLETEGDVSCNSTSNRVAGAACAAGISRLAGKYGFYAGAAAAGLGAALLAAKLAKSFKAWRQACQVKKSARRAMLAAYNRQAAEINDLLTEPEPEGEHTRYHFFIDGQYCGWTHSQRAAEKIAALHGWEIMPASSTLEEEEVLQAHDAAPKTETEAMP